MLLVSLLLTASFAYDKGHREDRSGKKYRIGVLTSTDCGMSKVRGMVDGLESYGYSSDDVDVIIKNAYGDRDQVRVLVDELARDKFDVIVSAGTFETGALKDKITETPIVFIGVGCSVELGYVEDTVSTGCNITGVDSHYVQLSGKRLELFKKVVTDMERVLVIYNPKITPTGPSGEVLYTSARDLGIDLLSVEANNRKEILKRMEENKDRVDGVMLMCNFLSGKTIDEIVSYSLEEKIPVMGLNDSQVRKGMLAFYGSPDYDEGYQASRLVSNILKGQDPRKIPVEPPYNLEFHVNLKTAERLGITIDLSNRTYVDKFVE